MVLDGLTRALQVLCTDFGGLSTHDLSRWETRQTFGAIEFQKNGIFNYIWFRSFSSIFRRTLMWTHIQAQIGCVPEESDTLFH
jgi:hypothetical protein